MRLVPGSREARRALRRITAACLAVAVFAASGGASLIGQVCRHHGGAELAGRAIHAEASASDAAPRHGTAPTDSGTHGHGHHTAPAAHHHGAAPPADAQTEQPAESHDAGTCTCLRACCTATPAPNPIDVAVVRFAPPAEAIVVVVPRSLDLLPRSSQATWFLPPGQGPPALT